MEDRFAEQFPDVALPVYDGAVTRSTRKWVRDRAENLLLIYGQYDPWSGGAFETPTRPTSARFFVPGATHGAQIADLATADRVEALAHAERMFGRPPMMTEMPRAAEAGARRDAILRAKQQRLATFQIERVK
jgi:hypothetical protein